MKVKKYIARSMPEAMQKIRKELGKNAVILHSKEVKNGGFLGLFKKKNIEVVAGVDPSPLQRDETKQELYMQTKPEKVSSAPSQKNEEILNEIQQLKKMIQWQAADQLDSNLPEYQLAYRYLLEQEVEETVAKEMINSIIKDHQGQEDITYEQVLEACGNYIENRLKPFNISQLTESKVIQLIGPTGVGKTTTIAKIAATLMLNNMKKVAFVTTDTYRIAAIDQLKTYARILNVPIEVAYSVEEYKNAIGKLNGYDVILVDTAGRNFREQKYVRQLRESLAIGKELDTYIVLALTAKPKDIIETYDQFNSIPKKGVIFTKMDETTQYGSLINLPFMKNIDIAFVTNGQDVPDDLLLANPKEISQLIIGDVT